MAQLYDGRIRVTTSAGAPVSGGKLRIYDANTTNLTVIYSDSGFSVPQANPVIAGSDGYCAQVFAAEGTAVDMQTETPVGVILKTWVGMVFLGGTIGILFSDFTNSRLRISGSGGIVSFEAGDPSPDNTGGKWRVGGYNGTQADTGQLDAAAITTTGTLDTGGLLTENTKKLPGIVSIAATTFTTQTTVPIALPNSPAGVTRYLVEVWDLVSSVAGVVLNMRVAFDSVPNFKATGTDYSYGYIADDGAGTIAETVLAAASVLKVGPGLVRPTTNPANFPNRLTINVTTPDSGNAVTALEGDLHYYTGANLPLRSIFTGYCYNSGTSVGYGRATYVQLAPNSGNITGKYRVTALRGFGE